MEIIKDKNCIIVKNFFSETMHQNIVRVCDNIEKSGHYENDRITLRHGLKNHPEFVKIHLLIQFLAEQVCEELLKPSYTYYSHYLEGATLKSHRDRKICYITVSFCVKQTAPWPLYINDEPYEIDENSLIIFKGNELRHYRLKNKDGHTCTMVLFHFVRPDYIGILVPDDSNDFIDSEY